MESGFDFEEIRKLMKGHKVGFGGYYGGYQAIMYDAIKKVYFVHLNRVKTDKRQDTKTDVFQERYFKLKTNYYEKLHAFLIVFSLITVVLWSRVSNSC
jgi:hypothetical protein